MKLSDFRYDSLDYWRKDDSEEATKIVNDYAKTPLKELFEFYKNVTERNDIPKKERELRLKILKLYIAQELDLVELDRLEYLIETAGGEIDQLRRDTDNLKKQFENHRHPTDRTYGEKPIW